MGAFLEIVAGPDRGTRHAVAERPISLGRDEQNEIPLLDEAASRRHAVVSRRAGAAPGGRERYVLRDLGSRNGTYLNGRRVEGEVEMRAGDEIGVGATRLRLVDDAVRARDTAPIGPPGDTPAAFAVDRAVPVEAAAGAARSPAEARLRALLALGRLIASADDPRALLEDALRLLPESLAVDRAAVYLAAPGLDPEPTASVGDVATRPSRSILERALAGAEALLLTAGEPLLGRESVAAAGIRSVIAAPLVLGGRRLGVIYADRLRTGGRFGDDDLAYLADLARQLAAALAALERAGEARDEAEAWRRVARRAAAGGVEGPPALVGESPSFRAALDLAERAAASASPVLVLGETGTGKELVARFIHDRSPRAAFAFVPANCAAIPEALLESELFGHERGAFTGADRRRRGLVELAASGTLFLDEIGEMPLAIQAKLLRVLEQKEVRRLGAERATRVDFRLVAATNRDLEGAVREGRFREDLFYRLAVISLRIPALRDRPGDAERLARHFLDGLGARAGRRAPALSAAAVDAIRRWRWPGNVRELRNAIERALVLAGPGEEIGPEPLGLGAAEAAAPAAPAEAVTLEEAEKRAIAAALRATGGKKGEAARLLGISWPTLRKKIAEYGLGSGDDA